VLETNLERIRHNLETLSTFNSTPDHGCTRLSFSHEHRRALDFLTEACTSLGMDVVIDPVGNFRARLKGSSLSAPAVMCGSHIDTVLHGGKFDGAAGVVAALEALTVIKEQEVSLKILFADSMPVDEIDAWRDKPEFNLKGQLGTYYVSFNVTKPPLNNPMVRKALVLAVDRDYIVKNIGKAGQQPAGAFVPTGLSDVELTKEFREVGGDYYDPSKEAYEANLREAKKLLADAGYPNGEGIPTLEYIYNEGTGHQLVAEALQAMWKEIGINITLSSQEWNTFLNTRKNGEYYMARNGWLADFNDPICFLDMWITGSGNNDAQWSNKEYDELIRRVKSSSDREERMELMHRAEDILFEEWILCPIYYYVDIYLKSEKLDGFYSSPLGYKYFMYTTIKD